MKRFLHAKSSKQEGQFDHPHHHLIDLEPWSDIGSFQLLATLAVHGNIFVGSSQK
jgi:hypothetical protein